MSNCTIFNGNFICNENTENTIEHFYAPRPSLVSDLTTTRRTRSEREINERSEVMTTYIIRMIEQAEEAAKVAAAKVTAAKVEVAKAEDAVESKTKYATVDVKRAALAKAEEDMQMAERLWQRANSVAQMSGLIDKINAMIMDKRNKKI